MNLACIAMPSPSSGCKQGSTAGCWRPAAPAAGGNVSEVDRQAGEGIEGKGRRRGSYRGIECLFAQILQENSSSCPSEESV
ncbi:Solute carrier family 12 member 2 [Dissostichus eleginoides]|uniref:Solute carrier family 12 member 2 n=1 Tax=Dissostichus eleginoides TaxID=100907 RepID=A0AAD9CBA0_DISEL|nr:Solute carrier family 12 member 2 [Dissostichus eleginoides]